MPTKHQMKGLKAAILTMSFIQMATNAIASVLANISMEFPGVSATAIQYLMTFPNLIVVVMSMITARLSIIISKKKLAVFGLFLGTMSGILSFLFHGSLVLLFVWAGLLGCGIGLVVPVATSLISDYFAGGEKDTLLGYQTSFANIGSMLMTFIGGMLAVFGWYYNYLVYLLAVPGLLLSILFIPEDNVQQPEESREQKIKIPRTLWFYYVVAAVFMLLFYMGPTNLAMLVTERQIGNTVTAGTAATILLLGGTVMGFLFGSVSRKIGKNTIPAGFFMLTAGYVIIYNAVFPVVLYVGSFIVGIGNTLALPQCMGSVVTNDKTQSTFLMSAVFAVANLGTFLAPMLTVASKIVMKNDLAGSRFLFTASVSLLAALVCLIYVNKRTKK